MRRDADQGSPRDRNSVQSVEKALRLLTALGRAREPLGAASLARDTGMSQTAVYRLLRALEKGGAVARLADSGNYVLGYLAHELAGSADVHGRVRLAAAGPMLDLQRNCGSETVGLYVPVNSAEFTCIETMPGPHRIRYMEVLYRPITIGRGATSLVFLAAMEERYGPGAVLSYLGGLPAQLRALPVADILELMHSAIRKGYGVSEGTRIPGLTSLSAPIRGRLGSILGALTLSWPSGRGEAETVPEWGEHMRAAAASIADRMVSIDGAQ